MKRLVQSESVARILVIKLSSLGDLLHALPAVHAVRIGLRAEIDWVVQEEYADFVGCFVDVARVIRFRRRSPLRVLPSLRHELGRVRYDLILDFQGLLKSLLVACVARGKRRIGPSFAREGTRWMYREVAGPERRCRHAVVENMDIVRYLNLAPAAPRLEFRFPGTVLPGGSPRVALVPASRWPSKNWPESRFVEVGRRLQRQEGASLYLLGGREDAPLCERVRSAIGAGAVNLAGRLSLPETGGVIRDMDLLIANDSGPLHLAAAVGTPCLALYGPTDPQRTGPYGSGHRVLRGSADCAPCFRRVCRKGAQTCMESLRPEQVAEAAGAMLAGKQRAAPEVRPVREPSGKEERMQDAEPGSMR